MKQTNQNRSVMLLAQSAVIAALYLVLTVVSASLNLAYGPVQFRLSEALTILPVFTPAGIPGLVVGCFISNLASPLGIVDIIFGTSATLIAALLSYMLRKIRFMEIPILSFVPPILINALVIGFEIAGLTGTGFSFSALNFDVFIASAISVGLGQLVVCFVLGLPLFITIKKNKTLYNLLKFKD